ncbi:serine hydrolase domain-containing protein [Actinokineospora sp. HUAS TT18]|uniref:serine hydrolase domain-containing protein n=1 Tax=Actinokineospora sp. HUAS TT18 TaxID=3447451 RepID=UPI003F527AA2
MDAGLVREWLDRRAADFLFSGAVLVWREGRPVFEHAAGLAHRGHRVPTTMRTRFGVASVTKLVTAVTALRLVDRGVLRLDQPLTEVLAPEHRPRALTAEHTLHHLLSHTSGLPNYHDDDDPTWASYTSCWDRVPTYHVRGPGDLLPLFADLPAVSPPGAVYQYADANFILVGLAIEAVTGRPFADVATAEVLVTAGMADSGFEDRDRDPERLATGYLVTDEPAPMWRNNDYSVPAGALPDGGLITTPHDLARLLDALVGGGLLGPRTTAAMTTPQGPPSGDLERYGYGCQLVVEDGEVTIIGHSGADPGVSALVSRYQAAATTIVVLCNYDRGAFPTTKYLAGALGLPDPRA